MGKYNFKADLKIAQKTELRVAELMEQEYNCEILEFNDDNKYDLLLTDEYGEPHTIEIKEDFMCKYTGNVSLEYESRGKLSGISISKADEYIYVIHTENDIEYWYFDTKDLREMVDQQKYFRIVNGGDKGSNTMNYLFKYNVFVEWGHKLN